MCLKTSFINLLTAFFRSSISVNRPRQQSRTLDLRPEWMGGSFVKQRNQSEIDLANEYHGYNQWQERSGNTNQCEERSGITNQLQQETVNTDQYKSENNNWNTNDLLAITQYGENYHIE